MTTRYTTDEFAKKSDTRCYTDVDFVNVTASFMS